MLLDDVYTYLVAQSTRFTGGAAGNIGKGIILDETTVPNTLTGLYETPGGAAAHTFSTGGSLRNFERPSLQVITRSTSYVTARANAWAAFTILDGFSGNLPTSTGTAYLSIAADQSPFSLGRDGNERFLMSVNFSIMKATG